MVDNRRIVRQWREGTAKVLVTLVRAEGSSYRRPGARLLAGDEGEFAGTISGGCLEAEVVRKAGWMVRDGAVVERYSTMFDDTAEIPYGLGCGGVVDLLMEPVGTAECEALLGAMEASLGGTEMTVATWLPQNGRRLQRAVFGPDGTHRFLSKGMGAAEADAVVGGSPFDASVFVETIAAPQRLFVLGAGEDARPVVAMAASLGWNVTVADGRPQLVRANRFPGAERVVVADSVESLGVAAADAVVVMTHSYEQDRTFLRGLLEGAGPGYLGLLGARHRSALLVGEVAAQLGRSLSSCCERVFAPVGLDLGGDGPEAIALAVVAEVQAWSQGKLAASRRLTAEDVAEQMERGGAAGYLQVQCTVGAE